MKRYAIIFTIFICLFLCTYVDAASEPEERHITSTWRKYREKRANKLGRKLIDVAGNNALPPAEKFTALQGLLASGASVNFEHAVTSRPLGSLIRSTHDAACVQLLCDAKANAQSQDNGMLRAIINQKDDTIKILLESKACPEYEKSCVVANYMKNAPNDLIPLLVPHVSIDACKMVMSDLQSENPERFSLLLNFGLTPHHNNFWSRRCFTDWQKEARVALLANVPVTPLVKLIEDYVYTGKKP